MINHPAWNKFDRIFYTFTEKDDYLDINHLDNCKNILSSQNFKVDKIITAKQVHNSGVKVISVSSKNPDPTEDKKPDKNKMIIPAQKEYQNKDEDGLITNSPGTALAIRTADCVPILIFDPQKSVISALHSGWKGTRLAILKEAVLKMKTHFNSHIYDIHVLTGPHIHDCCYEIKEDVANQFKNSDAIVQRDKKIYLNMLTQIKLTAQQIGIKHLDSIDLCTACNQNGQRFFSYRRDKNLKGYQYSIVMLKD